MSLDAKKIALGGLLLAFTEICIYLGSIIESNTLFLLAAASFLVGVMIRETGMRMGIGFCFAGICLGMLLAPNKFHVISYAGMGIYILIREFIWEKLGNISTNLNRIQIFWVSKYIIFNLIYLAGIFAGWEVLGFGAMDWKLILGIFAAGQIGLYVYDMAYEYFQRQIWIKLKRRLSLK